MLRVAETEHILEIQADLPAGMRALYLLLSLFPLLAPYQLIFRIDWQDYWNVYFLFVSLICLGALAVSAFLVWAAIAGLDSRVRFDRRRVQFTYSAGAPVVKWRTTRCPLASLARLRVRVHESSDGPPSYTLQMIFEDGRSFESGSSWSRDEIEGLVRRVSSFVGLPSP